MYNLLKESKLKDKGYSYQMDLLYPTYTARKVTHVTGNTHNLKKLSLPTEFLLISNSIYCNIRVSILGFGINFEIQTRRINE